MAVDTSKYEAARRGVNDEYSAKRVAADYGRFTSQQRFKRQKSDYGRSFRRGHGNFMGGFASRGLTGGGVRSGGFQRAIQQRVGDYTRGLGRMEADNQQSLNMYDQQNAQLDAWRRSALADIEMRKQAEIAQAALNLKAIRPLIGGY